MDDAAFDEVVERYMQARRGGALDAKSANATAGGGARVLLSVSATIGGRVRASAAVVHTRHVKYAVIGAGQTGLLFTHRCVVAQAGTVALVDRRESIGGHWNDAYSFVRLHQPKGAYGIEVGSWRGNVERDLATRDEVLQHYDTAMRSVLSDPGVTLLLGHEVERREVACGSALLCTRVDRGGASRTPPRGEPPLLLVADGIIDCTLMDVPWHRGGCAISGAGSHSVVTPSELPRRREGGCARAQYNALGFGSLPMSIGCLLRRRVDDRVPAHARRRLVVIGGGKSGCDTVLHLRRLLGVRSDQPLRRLTWVVSRPLAFYRRVALSDALDVSAAHEALLREHERAPHVALAALPSYPALLHHFTSTPPRTTHFASLGDDEMRELRWQASCSCDGAGAGSGAGALLEGARLRCMHADGTLELDDGRTIEGAGALIVSCTGATFGDEHGARCRERAERASALMSAPMANGGLGKAATAGEAQTLFALSSTLGGVAHDMSRLAAMYFAEAVPSVALASLRRSLRFMPWPPYGDEHTFWRAVRCHVHNIAVYDAQAQADHERFWQPTRRQARFAMSRRWPCRELAC